MTVEIPMRPGAWLEEALDDRRRASYYLAGGEYGRACFTCRHSVEKLLRAFLLAHHTRPPKSRKLARLLDRCLEWDPSLSRFEEAARTLDQYFLGGPVPDIRLLKRPYTEEEARTAFTLVEDMVRALTPMIVDHSERAK